jgi:hypothetical protein
MPHCPLTSTLVGDTRGCLVHSAVGSYEQIASVQECPLLRLADIYVNWNENK